MEDKKKDIEHVESHLIKFLSERENHTSQEIQDEVWLSIIHKKEQMKKHSELVRREWFTWIKISIAACLVIAIGVGSYFTIDSSKEPDLLEAVIAMQNSTISATNNVELVMSSGNKVTLPDESKIISQNEDGTILIDQRKVPNSALDKEKAETTFNQVIVPYGKHIQLALADGSVLDINSGTKVVYPQTFKKEKREIYVEGEIFIDVQKANGVPFIVRTSKFAVNVLGTAFNVRAYPEDINSEVVLQRGKVEIKDTHQQTVVMQPNELVSLRNGKYANKEIVNASEYISWKDGLLLFKGEPMMEVIKRLHQFYGLQFDCDNEVRQITLYGKLDINEPIEKVLLAITTTTGLNWEFKKNTYIFKKRE